MKVAIIYKIFNNYRKPIFDRLAERVDLLVLHSADHSGIKNESAPYSIRVPNFFYGKKTTNVWLFVEKYLLRLRPGVVIHEFNPSLISLHTTYIYCKLFGKKFIPWGHGYNKHTQFNVKSLKIRMRFFFLKRADAILLYGQRDKQFFSQYFPSEKIFVAQNTLDTDLLKRYRSEFESKGLAALKVELGYRFDFNIVYIGRLIEGKRPDILVDLCDYLLKRHQISAGFQIIGGGPFLQAMKDKIATSGLGEHFTFHGELHDDYQSGRHLFASDLLVMPGYLGLSINHAMCFDTPVVSYEEGPAGPHHSPEVEYVVNNETGYLARNWDMEDMAAWVRKYYKDKALQASMKERIRHYVDHVFPSEKMVDGIYDAIEYSLKK